MCACVCISVCMHACMCVLQAKECMHACTCTHAYVHVCAQACVHVFVCTCLHECIRVVCASVLLSDMHCSVPDDPPVGHTHPPGTPGPASGTRPPQRPHKWRQAAHPHPAAGWPHPPTWNTRASSGHQTTPAATHMEAGCTPAPSSRLATSRRRCPAPASLHLRMPPPCRRSLVSMVHSRYSLPRT